MALVALTTVLLAGAAPNRISGTITAVNLRARTFTVMDSSARRITILVDRQSTIVLDGDAEATLDDLFPGDEVSSAKVRQRTDGRLLLVKAVVSSGADEDEADNDELDVKSSPPAPAPGVRSA
jgi:hypothetical protein